MPSTFLVSLWTFNNNIAEQQFNLSQVYLHDNLSELLTQTFITFEMENIPHWGKTNGGTTVAEKRMRACMQLFHTELLQEARKDPDNIHKGNVAICPLTEKDIYPKAWEEKKPNKQT